MNQPDRIHFLDNLRAVVILLVVVLHGSMTYMADAPEWWYVVDTQNSLFFTIVVLLVDIPIMQIMFFIAGYFALPSLIKRGPAGFLRAKFTRVGAPWLVGVLLLAPPTAYLVYYTRAYLLVFQPLRVPLYVGYFALGIYAYLHRWFSSEGYTPLWRPWVALWLLSGMLYLANRLSIVPYTPAQVLAVQIAHAILFNAFCLSSLMAGVALFQQTINKSTPFWSSLSANAYGIYYAHPLVLYPLAYAFVSLPLPLFAKAPLVILLGLLLSWAGSAFVLRRAPLVRRAFV